RFTIVSDLPTNLVNGTVNAEWERKSPDTQPLFTSLAVDENFADVFGVSIVEGRWFSKDFTADSANFIVNESTLKIMGMDAETAVGQPLMFQDVKGKIIGVVKDFNFQPLQQPIGPLVMGMNRWGGTVVVRTQPGQTDASIDALGDIWEELNPAYPFSYDFVDNRLPPFTGLNSAWGPCSTSFRASPFLFLVLVCMDCRRSLLSGAPKRLACAKHSARVCQVWFTCCRVVLPSLFLLLWWLPVRLPGTA